MTESAEKNSGVAIVVVPRERHSIARECVEFLYAFTKEPFEILYVDSDTPKSEVQDLFKRARRKLTPETAGAAL